MRILNLILLIFIVPIAFPFCKKPGCLGSAGNRITVSRPLSSFSAIVLDDNINIILTQGNEERMEIEAPENIIANISSTISGTILSITNMTDCRWARDPDEKINVRLFFKNIEHINYLGSGNISNTDTLKLARLQIETELGAGDIELTMRNGYTGSYIYKESTHVILHGSSDVCFTYTNARGTTDLSDFFVKKLVIDYGGLTDTKVNVSEEIEARVFYKGNILYRGNPNITVEDYFSTGRLVRW